MYISLSQKTRTQPDWSALPFDGLEEISRRLLSWHDYFNFRSVCSSWRSAAPKRPRIPLLLVTTTSSIFSHPNFLDIELYTITSGWEHLICGSSRGWICLDFMTKLIPIHLHNPFTGVDMVLPVLPDHAFPTHIVLSADPALEPENCVVMANCFNGSVLYCRPGDASWTCAAVFREILPADPLFSGGKTIHTGMNTEMYLVVSSGNLLLAVVTLTNYRPSGCEIFRIDLDGGQLSFIKLQDLDGCAFFVGPWCMSLSIDISSATKCKGNCIYYIGAGAGNRIFDMEDGSISTLTEADWPFMVWFTPSP